MTLLAIVCLVASVVGIAVAATSAMTAFSYGYPHYGWDGILLAVLWALLGAYWASRLIGGSL